MKHAAAAARRGIVSTSDIVPLVDGDAPIGLNPTELIELNNLVRRVSTMELVRCAASQADSASLTAHRATFLEKQNHLQHQCIKEA